MKIETERKKWKTDKWTTIYSFFLVLVQPAKIGSSRMGKSSSRTSGLEAFHLYLVTCWCCSSACQHVELGFHWNSPWAAVWFRYSSTPYALKFLFTFFWITIMLRLLSSCLSKPFYFPLNCALCLASTSQFVIAGHLLKLKYCFFTCNLFIINNFSHFFLKSNPTFDFLKLELRSVLIHFLFLYLCLLLLTIL